MIKEPLNKSAQVALLCLGLSCAHAEDIQIVDQPLPNGDFSLGLEAWTIEISPDPATPPGTIQVEAGAARLVKGGAYLTGLSQDFSAPEGLLALRLRLADLPQFQSTGAFVPEAFDVHVTGANGFSRAASFRPGASAAANATAVPSGFNLGDGVTFDGDVLRIPLPDIPEGETLEFAVSLVGASADTLTSVAIDDVVLEVEAKIIPDRIDGCGIFRDRFQISHGVAGIARCAQGQINDTGITLCSGGDCPAPGLPGQDAEFGRDALAGAGQLNKLGSGEAGFDFTKLDIDGEPLPSESAQWACVRDNYTGLVWEAKLDDPDALGHFAHSYTWFQPDADINGGEVGTPDGGVCEGSACDTRAYVTAFNEQRICGVTDWRLPTRHELDSIVHAGRSAPALDPGFFPLGPDAYWSATPAAADPASAWIVDFDDGSIETELKTTAGRIRLVREVR
jgi:hypothetical protein